MINEYGLRMENSENMGKVNKKQQILSQENSNKNQPQHENDILKTNHEQFFNVSLYFFMSIFLS